MGGMQKHSYFLAKYLTLNGVEVVLAHFTNEEVVYEKTHEAFSSFNLEKLTFKRFKFPEPDKLPGHYLRSNKHYSETILEYFEKELSDFDAIYAQGFTGWAFVEQKNENFPLVFTNFHGYEMFQKAPSLKLLLQHIMLRKAVKRIVYKSDFVISFGGVITQILHTLGMQNDKIIECPIGIEEDWLNSNDVSVNPPKRFVFIGRYERRKGVEELTEAIKLLPKSSAIHFDFIGPIPKEKQLSHPNLTYHGAVYDASQIKNILQKADVLVCPSYSEGMPTVIMEAMASGLAVLATNVGAISQQVDENNGILLSELSPKHIADAITRFINMPDEELLSKKSVSLQKVQQKFLWKNVIQHKIKAIEHHLN